MTWLRIVGTVIMAIVIFSTVMDAIESIAKQVARNSNKEMSVAIALLIALLGETVVIVALWTI